MGILSMQPGHLLISVHRNRRQLAQTSKQARAVEPDTEQVLLSKDQGDIPLPTWEVHVKESADRNKSTRCTLFFWAEA